MRISAAGARLVKRFESYTREDERRNSGICRAVFETKQVAKSRTELRVYIAKLEAELRTANKTLLHKFEDTP